MTLDRRDITTVTLQAFKTYKTKQVIRFPVGSGLGFIKGVNNVSPTLQSNAAGKSTILDAICWCLYGKTLRGLLGPSIVPWTKRDLRTQVIVEISGVEITRARSPIILLLSGGTVEQEAINSFIKLSYEEFKHSVMVGQFTTFFTELLPTARSDLFTKILDVGEWDSYSVRAKEITLRLENEGNSNSLKVARLESELSTLDNDTDIADLDSIWEEDREKDLKILKEDLVQVKKRIGVVEERHSKHVILIERLGKKFDCLKSRQDSVLKYMNPLISKLSAIDRAVSRIKGRQEVVEEQRDNLNALEGICYVCGQRVGRQHKARELSRIDVHLKKLGLKLKSLEGKRSSLNVEIDIVRKDIALLSGRVQKIGFRIEDEKGSLFKIKSDIKTLGRLQKDHLEAFEDLKRKISPFSSKLRDSRRVKRKVRLGLKSLLRKNRMLKDKEASTRYWVKGFKDVKASLIQEILLQLELEVNSVVEGLGLGGWRMLFCPDETQSKLNKGFVIKVLSPHNKKPVVWESWCGGETSRLRLAAQLGLSNLILNRKGVAINFQAFDEPTSWMASKGVEDLVTTLKTWATLNRRWVWLIDHRTLSYQFDSVVTVVRKRTGSKIIQEEG